jgi:carnosine N-methyltransferase
MIGDAIDVNAELASAIVSHTLRTYKTSDHCSSNLEEDDWRGSATGSDLEIARSTIRQFYRDWSAEGAEERNASHKPVLRDLAVEFSSLADKSRVRVLVPGAGLCRLAFNIAAAGFTVEANEISYHQLLASHFILHHAKSSPVMDLYPWALSFSNNLERHHQLEKVVLPDVHPAKTLSGISCVEELSPLRTLQPEQSRFTINATEFSALPNSPNHRNAFDAVTTVFFLDTAPNLLRYIETVHRCLKTGGIWINVGPLLWNCFENGPAGRREGDWDDDEACKARRPQVQEEHGKLEFSEDEVLMLLEHCGFRVEKHEERAGEAGYIRNRRNMLQNIYRLSHWIARKI